MGKKIFEVEISNDGPRGYETATALELPATWAEFHDALEKARITDGACCGIEVTEISRGKISEADLGEVKNLYELNLFAQRLSMLEEDQARGFEGLLQMERGRRTGPIPLHRLIDLTFHTNSCHTELNVRGVMDLGAFLYERGMLSDAAASLLAESEENSEFRNGLLALLGKRHMEKNAGVFTSYGYVEPSASEWEEAYAPGKIAYFTQSGAPVVLKVGKAEDHGGLSAVLNLPACEADVNQAFNTADIFRKEYFVQCVDCLIPAARKWINDAVQAEGGIEAANEFARQLEQKERIWDAAEFTRYKALLAASGCACLSKARGLLDEMDEYPQYYVSNNHEAIISKEVFQSVQALRDRRSKKLGSRKEEPTPFHRKIDCGVCGSLFRRKRCSGILYWECRGHNLGKENCPVTQIPEQEIQAAFLRAYHRLRLDGMPVLRQLASNLRKIREQKFLWREDIVELNKQIGDLLDQNHTLAEMRKHGLVDSDFFIAQTNGIAQKLREAQARKERLLGESRDKTLEQTQDLLELLEAMPEFLERFDGEIFEDLVERVVVDSGASLRFRLKNGLELKEYTERTAR